MPWISTWTRTVKCTERGLFNNPPPQKKKKPKKKQINKNKQTKQTNKQQNKNKTKQNKKFDFSLEYIAIKMLYIYWMKPVENNSISMRMLCWFQLYCGLLDVYGLKLTNDRFFVILRLELHVCIMLTFMLCEINDI